jgi:hypothetical protein
MKLIRSDRNRLVYQLSNRDKQWLLKVLDRYPLIPPARQPLSQSADLRDPEASQRLLDEALAEQRAQNRRRLQKLLQDSRRLKQVQSGWHLVLSPGDREWLLQILNDVRVGSWILLGSPENDLSNFEWNDRTAPHAVAMEMAGLFQMRLLEESPAADAGPPGSP